MIDMTPDMTPDMNDITGDPRPVSFITWLVQYGNVGPARTLELDYLDDGAVLVACKSEGLRVEYATASAEATVLWFLFGRSQVRRAAGHPPLPSARLDSPSPDQPATPTTLPIRVA